MSSSDEEKPPTPPRVEPGDPGYVPFLDDTVGVFGRAMYFDRDGQPISMRQASLLGHPGPDPADPSGGYARIASDSLDGGNIWVSTVWLGLDHSLGMGGPPLIFETMVFVRSTAEQLEDRRRRWAERGWPDFESPWEMDLQCVRYSTEDEAREGHRVVVDSLRVKVELLTEALNEE